MLPCVWCGEPDEGRARVSSAWPAGSQPRSPAWSVGRRSAAAIVLFPVAWTLAAILCVPCGALACNHAPVGSVLRLARRVFVRLAWRAGPRPRSCVLRAAGRPGTASLCVWHGVLDPTRDPVCCVRCAGL